MKGSSGVAVLLVGVGILGMGLAFTGRGADVVAAIMGKASGSGADGTGEDCPEGTTRVEATGECIQDKYLPKDEQADHQVYVNAAGGARTSNGGNTGWA